MNEIELCKGEKGSVFGPDCMLAESVQARCPQTSEIYLVLCTHSAFLNLQIHVGVNQYSTHAFLTPIDVGLSRETVSSSNPSVQ